LVGRAYGTQHNGTRVKMEEFDECRFKANLDAAVTETQKVLVRFIRSHPVFLWVSLHPHSNNCM